MRKSIVTASVVVVLVAADPTPVGGVAGFGDVASGRFFTDAVQWMVDNDITTGTSPTCFSPEDPVTRGQAAAFMHRMEGEPTGSPPHTFSDIVAPWQEAPVSWMVDNGITTGTSPTTYSPDATLTRGQLAALLHRLAGEPTASGHPFLDISKPWQQAPVAWMVEQTITTGTSPTTFSPDDPVTRGQLATFFHRFKGRPAVVVDPDSPECPTARAPTSSTTSTTTTTTTPPANLAVAIVDFAFDPVDQTISVGDSITWTWAGSASHSTTSTTGEWGSSIQASGSFTHQFDTAGTFTYFCQVHPNIMRATITVGS